MICPNPSLGRGFALLALLLCGPATTPAGAVPPPREPQVAGASDEPQQAAAAFALPAGLAAELFAAEPQVANPAVLSTDNAGRVYVGEVFRARRGVTDNRQHDDAWLDADLASRTVADRLAYHRRLLGPRADDWSVESDRIRELIDTDGDGRADRSTVFAAGFNGLAQGLGAGVLARRGDVFYACIPDLWRLRDTNADGVADERTALVHGFGVRTAFFGHDLHGLVLGPDGRLYFTVGDRGYHVEHEGRIHADAESGAVFRCETDGSSFEVVATGLRNPQELAFDDLGNLFTVDNNSDSGDRARLVQIVPGGDSGWRMSGQHRGDRGPFGRERHWELPHHGQPAWIVPPLAHVGVGPAGFAFDPGTGLTPHFRGRFLLADFRGAAVGSGVRTFRVRPAGGSFGLADEELSIGNVLATDLEVGPDGALWVSDWVEGWVGSGKGRLWRFVPQGDAAAEPIIGEVRELLAGDWAAVPDGRLVALLGHADRRIRLESQWELARRGAVVLLCDAVADTTASLLARVHAIQGLGQVARRTPDAAIGAEIVATLADPAWELRLVAARTLGELGAASAAPALLDRLADDHAHVRAATAIALGRIGPAADATAALVAAVRREAAREGGFDPHARHALVMGLAGADSADRHALADDADVAVRLVACLAMRRHADPAIAGFLTDPDPRITVEAARAIHDVPIPAANAALAARLLTGPAAGDDGDAFLRRSLAACEREGSPADAARLAEFVSRADATLGRRLEALAILRDWSRPSARDRVLGAWRPFPGQREAKVAQDAVAAVLPELVAAPLDERLRTALFQTAGVLGVEGVGALLAASCEDPSRPPESRAEVLAALAAGGDPGCDALAARLSQDPAPVVRMAARRILVSRAAEPHARAALAEALSDVCAADSDDCGPISERQGAVELLAKLDHPAAREAIEGLVARLRDGTLEPGLVLEVLDAAGRGPELVAEFAATGRDVLAGGDASRGHEIFLKNGVVQCVRCHKYRGAGGEVGPALDGISSRRDRAYLLQSILEPSAQIATGYQTTIVVTDEGRAMAGIVQAETPEELVILTADGKQERVSVAAIEDRSQGPSAMPADIATKLSRRELRDLVEWLAMLRE
ncbi:MAG: PVC-type heme-binding CxxCH protein [Pirellulales bacterium]